MKIKLNSLSIICAIFMYSACGNSAVNSKTAKIASDSVPTITIRLPDIDSLENLYLSEIADSVYYVALSDKPFLVSNDLRIETTDSVMVIGRTGPSNSDETIRLYDLNGNFKRKIGGMGRGPGEYVFPTWGINSNTNRAYIHTYMHQNSLQTYDLAGSNLNMISKTKNDAVFYGNMVSLIYPVGDNIIIPFNVLLPLPSRPELILYNPKTNTIIDSLSNYHLSNLNGELMVLLVTQPDVFSEYENELYYICKFSDTLYRVTEKEILPFAIFDFGEYKFPIEIFKAKSFSLSKYWEEIGKAIRLAGVLRTSNMLYVQFSATFQKRMVKFIYALNLNDFTGRYYKGHFINDLDNGPDYSISALISSNPNQIIDASTLKIMTDDKFRLYNDKYRLFPDNKMPKKLKNVDEFQRLWDKSTEDSNPIIQFLKLK